MSQTQVLDDFGIVERNRQMRGFLHRFVRRTPALAEYHDGPRASVNLKTGERVVEQAAERAADAQMGTAEIQARVAARTRQLVDEAIEGAAQRAAEWRIRDLNNHIECTGPTIREILQAVTTATGVSAQDVVGPRRTKDLTAPRFLAVALMRELRPDLSLPAIGQALRRDHTSIMHALRRFTECKGEQPFVDWLAHDAIVQLKQSGETP
jgi:chromosomal replication initiation ATPase DnaA